MLSLDKTLKNILKPYYVDYVGFADLSNYEADLAKFGSNIVKGYNSGISIG